MYKIFLISKYIFIAFVVLTIMFTLNIRVAYALESGDVWKWLPGTSSEKIAGLSNITQVSVGEDHSLALNLDGTVWSWGKNAAGQLGNGTRDDNYIPVQVINSSGSGVLVGVKEVAAGNSFSVVLKKDGTVWMWGYNLGLSGTSSNYSNTLPVEVLEQEGIPLSHINKIAIGRSHVLAIKDDGKVFEWGYNFDQYLDSSCGQSCSVTDFPIQIKDANNIALSGIMDVAGGFNYSLIVKQDGTVWGWGSTSDGQLGKNNQNPSNYIQFPTKIDGLSNIEKISAKSYYNLALDKEGYVYEWGDKYFPTPSKRPYVQNILEISAGYGDYQGYSGQGVALRADGVGLHWQARSINSPPDIINDTSRIVAVAAQTTHLPTLFVVDNHPVVSLQDYKQNRNADGSYVSWALQGLFNISDCPTMASDGCAITSFADVLSSYGVKNLPDGTGLDPGNLNKYFGQNAGTHSGCFIYFNTAGRVANHKVLYNDFPSIPYETRKKNIDDSLNAGNLVIAGIGGHFVVLYKKATINAPDGSPDYYIADPFRYYPYATGSNTGKLLSQAYHSLDQLKNVLQVVVLDNKISTKGKSWVVVAHSPVNFIVTDPNGKQTGHSTTMESNINDIPNSSYGMQQGLIDDTGVEPPQPDMLYYGQEDPTPGVYKVEVTGTGSGEYKLDFAEASGPDNSTLQSLEGTAEVGKTDTYTVTVADGETQPPTISKTVTFAVLNDDLQSLYTQGSINNKIAYNTLRIKASVAAKAHEHDESFIGRIITKIALRSFIKELDRQKGKHITEQAYQILYNDAELLLKAQ